MEVSFPVVLQQPLPGVSLTLPAGQRVASKRAAKKMRRMLKSVLSDVDISSITFTCEDGSPLPDTTAAEFGAQHGRICARSSGRRPRQPLHLSTLQAELSDITRGIRNLELELELGRPPHLEEQRLHRKAQRRDISLRARDLISIEGGQPAGSSFYDFSARLSPAFLQERNLTEAAIIRINSVLFFQAEAIAQHTPMPPEELHECLEELTGAKLERMTVLYNYVMQRLQQQQQQQA